MIAISWETHRRTRSLCHELKIPLHELTSGKSGLRRYGPLTWRTARVLASARPQLLLVQNPSIVLSCIAAAYRALSPGARLIVDAHNIAIEQLSARSRLLRAAAQLVVKAADRVIVTNTTLADIVRNAGGRPVVLPDPLPVPPERRANGGLAQSKTVTVISTFADDEPIAEIIAAAKLPEMADFRFCFTGRSERWLRDNGPVTAPNIEFLGFVPDDVYWQQLYESRVIVDLTTRDACLVCGAYEALAVGRPMVLSDSRANRELFEDAACFAKIQPRSIADAVTSASAVFMTVNSTSAATKARYQERWSVRANEFQQEIESLRTNISIQEA